jgi:hypothetical protein
MLSNSEIWPPSSSMVVLKLNLKSSLEGSLSSDLVEGESREFQAPKWVSYALEGYYETWGLPYDLYDREFYLSLQGSCISLCTGEEGCEVGYSDKTGDVAGSGSLVEASYRGASWLRDRWRASHTWWSNHDTCASASMLPHWKTYAPFITSFTTIPSNLYSHLFYELRRRREQKDMLQEYCFDSV